MRGKIYEQAIQQQQKKHINGFWKFKIISNSSLQKYNQEEEILFPTSETGKKKCLLVKLCYQTFQWTPRIDLL